MASLFTKSPYEHALATERGLEKSRRLGKEPMSAISVPAPGYVRVHFHSHLFKIYDHCPPDISADVPLLRCGGLDLDMVRRMWGMETCLPIDPLRWKPFEPTRPNYLSPVALRVLSEGQGCVKVIEPSVSHETQMQRNARRAVINFFSLIYVLLARLVEIVYDCLETDTPFPALFRRLRSRAKDTIQAQREQMDCTWTDVQDFFVLLFWIGLLVAWMGGYVQFKPVERARRWVRTGHISLS